MEKNLAKIDELLAAFQVDSKLQFEKGNKAAGVRARKAALALIGALKQFRKDSVEADKK